MMQAGAVLRVARPTDHLTAIAKMGSVRDTCSFSLQRVLSTKVSFLGQAIVSTFRLENQCFVWVVWRDSFRTLSHPTTVYSRNWYNHPYLQGIVLTVPMACDYLLHVSRTYP